MSTALHNPKAEGPKFRIIREGKPRIAGFGLTSLLPDAFSELKSYVRSWSLASESECYAKRLAASMEEMADLYDAFPRLDVTISNCDKYSSTTCCLRC